MDPSRNSLPGDKFNPAVKKNTPGPSPVPVDPVGGERISVEAVEREIHTRTRKKDYSTSRSRRHQRDEYSGSGRFLWFAVALVALVYLSFLAFTTIKNRKMPKPTTNITAAVPAPSVTTPATADTATNPVAASETALPAEQIASALDVPALIANAKAAAQLAEDGRRLARERQYAMAEIKFEMSAKLTPGVFSVLVDWGNSLMEQQRWLAARRVLVQALAAEPTSVDARLMLARASYELKQGEDAIALARWVLEDEPYSEVAHQISADVLTGMNRHEEAIKHLQKLVAIDSNNHVAENKLGVAMIQLGQYAQAIRIFENVIRDEPGNSQAYYYRAICYINRDEPEFAVDVLVQASARFGQQFVISWTKSADFDSLRTLGSFQKNFGENTVIVAEQPAPEPVTTNSP